MEIQCNPMADFVLIDPIPAGLTEGGLALPEGADMGPRLGKVVKVGPGRVSENGNLIPTGVEVGNTVYMMFAYQQPIEVVIQGKTFLIVRARDIVALK